MISIKNALRMVGVSMVGILVVTITVMSSMLKSKNSIIDTQKDKISELGEDVEKSQEQTRVAIEGTKAVIRLKEKTSKAISKIKKPKPTEGELEEGVHIMLNTWGDEND